MLDNLPDPDSSHIFVDTEISEHNYKNPKKGIYANGNGLRGNFLGLKPLQLFILLVMLLLVVCLLGVMFLLVTGKIVPAFL